MLPKWWRTMKQETRNENPVKIEKCRQWRKEQHKQQQEVNVKFIVWSSVSWKNKAKQRIIPFVAGITEWCSLLYVIKVIKQDECQGVLSGHYGCAFIPACSITYSTGPLIFSRHILPSTQLVKSECSSLSLAPALAGATNRSNVCCRKGNKYDTWLLPYNASAEKW